MLEILDFESKVIDLQNHIKELSKSNSTSNDINISKEISSLTNKYNKLLLNIYENLTPWQKVQVARHPSRPHAIDYINNMIKDFIPLAGDRYFGEDKAIIGGLGNFDNQTVMIIGVEKGNTLESRIEHNFGMANPEGYRKSRRLMEMANKFGFPVITLVDTAGAYPGLEAEERGQGEAIAKSIETCLSITVPFVSVIIGEGGSGGALALAAADTILMLEHSIYSVISPEGCAAILWKNEQMSQEAAKNLALTANDLKKFGIIDEIIKEPLGGAQRDHESTISNVKQAISNSINSLKMLSQDNRKKRKHNRFLKIGRV